MANRLIQFVHVPDDPMNVNVLGSLVFDKRDLLGPRAVIDMRDNSSYQQLTRDFIAALYEHASTDQITSDQSFSSYGQLIRMLLDYCKENNFNNDFRMSDIDVEFLLDFKSHIRIYMSEFKSAHRRKMFGNLCRLITAGQVLDLAASGLVTPSNFRFSHDSDPTQPYPWGEALDIEDACRANIREVFDRLDKGKELLSIGRDPRGPPVRDQVTGRLLPVPSEKKPWNQLENLLWFVVNVMGGKFVKYSGRAGMGLSSFTNATNGAFKGCYRKIDVYSHLYPLAEDLIPFVILLAKTTGRNESSILNLNRDCLQEIDGKFILWYRKERGLKQLYKKIIANDGPYSPVALIKSVLRITTPLVEHAALEDRDKLFLCLTVYGRGLDPVKPLDPSYLKYQMNKEGGWCERYELKGENDEILRISLRRLRVYYLTRRYKAHGQLSKVSRDAVHSLMNTTVGYVTNDSTKHIHEQAIEDGIIAAYRVARPSVLVDNSLQEAVKVLGTTESNAERIINGEQDVFFASCMDFYNRPGAPKNTPCDKPWECFLCSNSIITRHVLPRVIAFRSFMEEQKINISTDEWDDKFKIVWDILNMFVLPKFSTEAIREAERYAANEILYIPLSMKV